MVLGSGWITSATNPVIRSGGRELRNSANVWMVRAGHGVLLGSVGFDHAPVSSGLGPRLPHGLAGQVLEDVVVVVQAHARRMAVSTLRGNYPTGRWRVTYLAGHCLAPGIS